MSRQIWKLQRPMATNMPVLEVMAYTEGKENLAFIPLSEKEIDEIFGDELKIYVKAKVNKHTGILEVKKRVPDQWW